MTMTYTKRDAMADEAEEKYEQLLSEVLDVLVTPIFDKIAASDGPDLLDPSASEAYGVWQEFGDDGLREYLEEDLRETAEEIAQAKLQAEYEEGPCCSQFSCPCGNSNSFRGF